MLYFNTVRDYTVCTVTRVKKNKTAIKIKNKVGANTNPCLTPILMGKSSDWFPQLRTLPSIFSCNSWMIIYTSTCPYVRGRTCRKKNFQTACQKQQPHRPFLRSRVPVRAWLYVQKKKIKNFQTTTQAVPSLS